MYAVVVPFKSVIMKKAASHEFYEEVESLNQLAVIIPLHPARKTAKQNKKKPVTAEPVTQAATPLPDFTTPVFKPRKHDML